MVADEPDSTTDRPGADDAATMTSKAPRCARPGRRRPGSARRGRPNPRPRSGVGRGVAGCATGDPDAQPGCVSHVGPCPSQHRKARRAGTLCIRFCSQRIRPGERPPKLLDHTRLTFAFPLHIVRQHAAIDQAAARDPRLPERLHPAARVRAEPGGDRPPVRPVVAGDGAQAPDEPGGKGLHQAGVEPQPLGGARARPGSASRGRTAAARLRRGRRADRGGRRATRRLRCRRISPASATRTCCASAATR